MREERPARVWGRRRGERAFGRDTPLGVLAGVAAGAAAGSIVGARGALAGAAAGALVGAAAALEGARRPPP